jgi:pimeloyl-ACP methyl ester carboxylesterase
MKALADQGQAAEAVELPNDPQLGAEDFAEVMRAQVSDVVTPTVVVHSGSGPLLPAAARAFGARHQVWLAAWVPDGGATFAKDVADHAADAFNPAWVGQDPTRDDAVAKEFVYHDCDEGTLVWALSTRRLFVPRAVYHERIQLACEIPSAYIVCTQDRTIRPEWQERMARERLGVEPIKIAAGHCPNISQPERLGAILVDLAEPG